MKKTSYLTAVLSFIGFLGWWGAGPALPAELQLEITSLKASYLVAEPVFVDFKLKNKSPSESIQVKSELELEKGIASLFIARGDGPFSPYQLGIATDPSQMPVVLGPSESIVHRQLLLYELTKEEFAFPGAGTYRIKTVYHGFGIAPDVESNILEIAVVEPGRLEAEALKLFKTRAIAEFIMNVGEDKTAVAQMERLMAGYGTTIYGKYAQFYLARRETQEHFERKPDYQRAVLLYRDLIQRDRAFPLAVEAIYGLGKALMNTGDFSGARQQFNLVLREAKPTRLIKGAQKLLEKIDRR